MLTRCFLTLLLLAALGAPAAAQLGTPVLNSHTKVHPRGRYVTYLAKTSADGVNDLYRTELKSGDVIKLSGTPLGDEPVGYNHALDSKGRFAIYTAEQDLAGALDLYRANLKTGESTKLSPALADGDRVGTALFVSKDRYVVFTVLRGGGETELWRAEVKSGALVELSGDVVPGKTVNNWEIGPKSRAVFFLAGDNLIEGHEFYRADLKSGKLTKLNDPLGLGGVLRSGMPIF